MIREKQLTGKFPIFLPLELESVFEELMQEIAFEVQLQGYSLFPRRKIREKLNHNQKYYKQFLQYLKQFYNVKKESKAYFLIEPR